MQLLCGSGMIKYCQTCIQKAYLIGFAMVAPEKRQ